MPYYQIKLKAQYIVLQWQNLSQDFQVCVVVVVVVVVVILLFTKELNFFFIIPGIIGLLCIFNVNKVHAYLLCVGLIIVMVTVLIT